jgi:hypothetical protein
MKVGVPRFAGLIGAVSGALACWPAGGASAQEYCVACSEPAALYRCVIEGAQPRGGQSLQMLCVTAMAREGGHATCGVKRGTVFECDGPVKRVPWTALETAPAQPAPAQPQPAHKPQPAATPAAPPPGAEQENPPQTVLEMAKRANEKTVEQMKKAGDTVKDATRKTWDCMLSLFTRC